ncbi:lasso peptide biosynthesis B2 protein [Luteimonas sp. R10]|uniref:lasso peptide biosynthesis B2 protein n=1 Tax=Luteimonas sp. R10 TaxID=3108176 RepID=UPI0030878B59|nr:lasso peptide biosynthesis B2 protein [Luteimonas sp. R10]
MGWKLHEDLSFCSVDGRLVFLDVSKDRYFRLQEAQEHAFASLVDGNGADETEIRRLAEQHILEETMQPDVAPRPASIARVTRSAFEETDGDEMPGFLASAEVLMITYATRRQLKRNRLKAVLAQTATYRRHRIARAARIVKDQKPVSLHRASATFMRARAFSPIDTICLLDSISMLKFLANRGLHANLVFAVASDPFSAHCWVQSGDAVLNDTVGTAHAHTPIWML